MCVVGFVPTSSVWWGKTHPTRSPFLSQCEGRHGGFTPASCRGFNSEGRLQLRKRSNTLNRGTCRSSFELWTNSLLSFMRLNHSYTQHHHAMFLDWSKTSMASASGPNQILSPHWRIRIGCSKIAAKGVQIFATSRYFVAIPVNTSGSRVQGSGSCCQSNASKLQHVNAYEL